METERPGEKLISISLYLSLLSKKYEGVPFSAVPHYVDFFVAPFVHRSIAAPSRTPKWAKPNTKQRPLSAPPLPPRSLPQPHLSPGRRPGSRPRAPCPRRSPHFHLGPFPPPRPGHHPVPQPQCLLPQRELERRCTAACGNSSGASAPSSMKKAGEKSSSVRGLVLPRPSDRLRSIPIILDARRHPPWNPKYYLANIRRLWCWSWSDSGAIYYSFTDEYILTDVEYDGVGKTATPFSETSRCFSKMSIAEENYEDRIHT